MRNLAICMLTCTALISCFAYADSYQAVRIVAPESEETVHNNSGNLSVSVATSPLLQAGDRFALLLDNKAVARGTKRHYVLHGIDRGTHSLQLQVNAADGTVLAVSQQVIFHMMRASRLFQNRQISKQGSP